MNLAGAVSLSRRCGALMLLALGVCLLPAPAESRAGCIHPSFLLRGNGSTGSAFFEFLPETGAMPIGLDDLAAPRPPKSPCPGGVCSKAPVVPLAPPTVVDPAGNDLAALCGAAADNLLLSTPFQVDDPLDRPEVPDRSIFHPPRPRPAPDRPALGTV